MQHIYHTRPTTAERCFAWFASVTLVLNLAVVPISALASAAPTDEAVVSDSVSAPADSTQVSSDAPSSDSTAVTTDTTAADTSAVAATDTTVTTDTSATTTDTSVTVSADTSTTDSSATVTAPAETITDTTTVGDVVVEQTETASTDTTTVEAPATTETSSGSTATVTEPVQTPQLTTDKPDYAPTDVVSIFGSFFQSLKSIFLSIVGGFPDGSSQVTYTDTVTTDENGAFTYQYQLDGTYRPDYTVTASDQDGTEVAKTTFTDSYTGGGNLDLFAQCMNDDGDGYTGADLGCHWTNGDLNGSNSTYHEDDATVQRLAIKDLTNGDHYAIIKYSTTKGGKHSYDFMTDDDYSELAPNPLTSADLCDPAISNLASCATLTPVLSNLITTDPNAGGKDVLRSNRHFKIRNGTWVSGGIAAGPTLLSGTYAGDSDTIIRIAFNVNTATCADRYTKQGTDVCEVLITWGAHVSSQADWGPGNSAVNISGSPYHVQLANIDNPATTGGGNDNQMAATAVVQTGTIIIHKDTVPDAAQDFSFTTTGGLTPSTFNLDDDADVTLPNTQTYTGVTAGTYTVTEGANAAYVVTIACTDPSGGTTTNNGTRVASIDLAAGETVECTYTNILQQAHLTVIKHVINDNGGAAVAGNWTMNVTATNPSSASFPGVESPGTTITVDAGAYSVVESGGPSGYTQTSAVGCSGTIAAGGTATCTITNDDIAPVLHLRKVVVNDNGGTATVANFTLTADGTTTNDLSGTSPVDSGAGLKADTFALSETSVTGYTASAWVCAGGTQNGSNITLALGQSATCTITNNDQAPHLIVIKHVINDNGGTAVASGFTTTISGVTTATPSAAGVESPGVNNVLTSVGSYSVDEGAHVGYDKTLSTDCSGTIALGQTKTCTITNDDIAPVLHLRKVVVNDNGGTATVANFTLTADGTTTNDLSGISPVDSGAGLKADTFALSETSVTGYTASAWVCAGGTQNGSNITLGLGQSATCTITNDDQTAHLKLVKVVTNNNGGSAVATNFTLSAAGPTPISGAGGAESDVNAGSYNLSETSVAGYTPGAWSCVGGTQNGASVSLALGQSATCTITNDDQTAHLKLQKIVINNNGGSAVATDFTLSAAGPTPISGAGGAESDVNAGTYNLSETTLPGYTASAWSCTKNNGSPVAGASITLGLGDTATCLIANDDQQAYIRVIKVVVNDNGGTAAPDDFNLTLEGNAVTSNSLAAVNPGTYTAGETLLTGYSFVGFTGDCDSNGDVTVALGQTKTCTLTNNDVQPRLTLIKTVVNDNGGTLLVADFPLFVNATGVVSGVTNGFNAGSYTASETNQPGYTAGVWGGDCAANGAVTLSIGDNKTCTITNDDVQPILHVIKHVVNDNGGTAVAGAFTMTVTGPSPSPASFAGDESGTTVAIDAGAYSVAEGSVTGYTQTGASADCAGTLAVGEVKTCTITNDDDAPHLILNKIVVNDNGGLALESAWDLTATGPTSITGPGAAGSTDVVSGPSFDAGSYVLSESTGPAGYTASGWTCSNQDNDGTISISLGETVTCTITNDDQAPSLHLRKVVVNDNGGTALATDWTLSAAGLTSISGSTPVDSDATFSAGSYNLSEVGPTGYVASSWTCVGGTQNGGNITLALGESSTCTITNNDIQPKLTVTKVVQNNYGGTAVVSNFTLYVNATQVTSGTQNGFEVGSYTVSEGTLPAGYEFVGITGDCAVDGSVALGLADVKSCTITNRDIQPRLIVIKHVINDDGDIAVASDFTMTVNGTLVSNSSFPGNEAGVTVTLNAGSYSANEAASNGYVKTLSADCSGTIAVGETKTCTITNNDIPHATRTLGFWQTHTTYTQGVFAGINPLTIGTHVIDSNSKLFAGFYSSIPKKSTGSQRTALDKARMQMLQQWLAAELNCQAFTCSAGTQTLLTSAATAWAGTNTSLIQSYASQLDTYNNSNDAIPISGQGSATPKISQSVASPSFLYWDVLP